MAGPLLLVYFISVVLFLGVLLSLGIRAKVMARLTGVLLFISGVLGMLAYGYGYFTVLGVVPEAVVRTVGAVFKMYLGSNDISTISNAPLLQSAGMQLLLQIIHIAALYCTASAIVTAIGERLIRTLNRLRIGRGALHLIYGVNAQSVRFAAKLLKQQGGRAVFVGSGGAALEEQILRMRGLLCSDEHAEAGDAAFLRGVRVRPGKRRVHVYCIGDDAADNLRYAARLRGGLESLCVSPTQTALTVILPEEEASASLQATETQYGYGSVAAYARAALSARLLMRTYPPYRCLSFDETGCATEDFDALIVGFGKTGQEVLRALVMNGQFAGSRFRATVVAKDAAAQSGSFFSRCPGLRTGYDIRFLETDVRSVKMLDLLREEHPHIRYTVVCTGVKKHDEEISAVLRTYYQQLGIESPVLICADAQIGTGTGLESEPPLTVYTPEVLCSDLLDREAMAINHDYHRSEGRTAAEDWQRCDYFSRMSCRASADYLDAFLHAAGTDRARVRQEGFAPSGALLENLAKTEHLRWCAFHYAMGYQPMPPETWQQRAETCRAQRQAGSPTLRIGKDTTARLHACLVDWDALDALSDRENAVTGGHVDYKQFDRDNVLLLPKLLESSD